MTTRVVEEFDDWESRPFDGGYAGLHELADDEFSGVVRSGTATRGGTERRAARAAVGDSGKAGARGT
jgi:hypothetical protein